MHRIGGSSVWIRPQPVATLNDLYQTGRRCYRNYNCSKSYLFPAITGSSSNKRGILHSSNEYIQVFLFFRNSIPILDVFLKLVCTREGWKCDHDVVVSC